MIRVSVNPDSGLVAVADQNGHAAAVKRGCIAAIGSFDGVHLGHQSVIDLAIREAIKAKVLVSAIIFDPHPQHFFRPDSAPFRLMDIEQQIEVLTALGVDHVIALDFNHAMAGLLPEQFVSLILHNTLGLKGIVCGFDFNFGARGAGKATDLERLCADLNITTHIVPEQTDTHNVKLSSSTVREALKSGDIIKTEAILGHPFTIRGTVKRGDQIGRTIGFPTLNLDPGLYQRPKAGIYVSRTHLPDGRSLPSVSYWGTRPSLDGIEDRFETHVFDFEAEIYVEMVEIELLDFIRDDAKFDSLDALKAQIAKDCEDARAWFKI